jgi:hypothetical protein
MGLGCSLALQPRAGTVPALTIRARVCNIMRLNKEGSMIRLSLLVLILSLVVCTGCSTEPIVQPDQRFNIAQAEFNVPPKELAEKVKAAVAQPPLNLSVTSQDHGVLLTSYREYQGEFHIARHWKEQSRFRIEISPDWDNPTGKAKLTVVEQTQQRRTNNQAWEDAPELQRPERAKEVLDQIVKNVK